MAITATLSNKELERVASLAYEGYAIRVSLANDIGNTLSAESSVADCDTLKVSGGGYTDHREAIGAGSYDVADQRYELPTIDAEFTATDAGYTFNTIYAVIGSYNNVAISNTALASNVATITTATNHGFNASDLVYIAGATDSDYDGYHIISTTPTPTSFTFGVTLADKASAASIGTAGTTTEELYLHSLTVESPSIVMAAGQTQTYRIVLATDD